MIIRHIHRAVIAHLICLTIAQNDRSYDTNDWVPITQKTGEDATQKKATGRVLNLDSPSQKFFPDEYTYKKSRPNFQSRPKHKERYNVPKYENSYQFELPPSLPQNGPPNLQYYPTQELQLPNYQEPPPLNVYRPPPPLPPPQQYVSNPQLIRAPPPNQPSTYQQYQVPAYNTTYYQTINPVSINQELLGSLQYQNINGGQENKVLANTESSTIRNEKGVNNKENVQLVYVPLENLKGNQNIQLVPQDSHNVYKQIESPRYETPVENHRLAAIEQDFIQQALQATKLQEKFQQGEPLLFQISTTTPKPVKKRKPHQPPLAVYLEGEKQPSDITDVLSALHDAKSIAVQDSIQAGSPQIFIGPSTLESPEYTKFPLPYLNSIDGNRINRQIDNLPFFVAPLSFKTPPGYSKIPLPAPHVGSVVVSNKEDLLGKRSTPRPNTLESERDTKTVKEIAPVTQRVEALTPQPYLEQTYYDQQQYVPSQQPQYVPSQQPQLLQFAVNDHKKQYNLPVSNYNPQIVGQEYNLPLKSLPEVPTQTKATEAASNSKIQPDNSFHYSYAEENTKTTPKNNKYNEASKSLSYTGPQTYDQEDRRPYQQPYSQYENQKQNQDLYSNQEQIRYEPIATTFDATSRPEEVINIKPKAEGVQKQNTNSYTSTNQGKTQLPDVSPLELAINEFELHQINTQLEGKPRVKNQYNYKTQKPLSDTREDQEYKFDPELHRFASTPATILRDSYVETTIKTTSRPRNRVRSRTTKATTLPPPELETYTVLEDFAVNQNPQYNQYTVQDEVQNVKQKNHYSTPSNVQYISQDEDIQMAKQPHYSDQYIVQNEETQTNRPKHQYSDLPSSRYNLQNEEIQTVKPKHRYSEIPNTRYNVQNEDIQTSKKQEEYNSPGYSEHATEIEKIPTKVYSLNPNKNTPIFTEPPTIDHAYTLNQNLMDQQILQSGVRHSSPNYEQQGQFEVDPHQYTSQPNIESNKEYHTEHSQDTRSRDQEYLSEYTSSLEDPSVRTLLVAKLLVPTTSNDNLYTGPQYLPTTEKIVSTTTTTVRPVETTPTRVRSRTRGGSRFNTHSTTSRPLARTRTKPTRATTERSRYSQEETYNTKNTNSKQRFRTRGRTTTHSPIERHSTAEQEVYDHPTTESIKIRTHPDGSQSYSQYEQAVQPQRVVSLEPAEEDYSTIYSTSARPIIHYENTASTIRPSINVQVTHPDEVEAPKEKVRVRGRIRDRPKVSTTTERVVTNRITTSPVAQKEDSEEFFGFFRQPDFGPPQESRVEVPSTTPRPSKIFSYQTPSQHGEDYQLSLDNTHVETSTVRFVGEIVPKYTSSREVITETETPRPRIRSRTRTPQKKAQISKEKPEQSTRRSNIIRSRGKTHYKLPETLKKNTEDDDDVEGGNYPMPFLQGRRGGTTASPNFQITVGPEEEEDQALNPSLYRPNIVASPEEWHDASVFDPEEEKKTDQNILDNEEITPKQSDDIQNQPYALPVQAITETQQSTVASDESFKETTRQIEEQFEAINNFETEKPAKQKRRKGVWKLIKHRPVDRLETSESQNYFSVLNSYHDIEKVNHKLEVNQEKNIENNAFPIDQIFNEDIKNNNTDNLGTDVEDNQSITEITNTNDEEDKTEEIKTTYIETTTLPEEEHITTQNTEDRFTTTQSTTMGNKPEQEDFLDSIYEMFGMSRQNENQATTTPSEDIATTPLATTTQNLTFPEELTETPTTSSTPNATETAEIETTTVPLEDFFTTPELEAKHNIKTLFGIQPWDMKEVRTSTSTEVSHETEICYKGRCIRSHDRKKRL